MAFYLTNRNYLLNIWDGTHYSNSSDIDSFYAYNSYYFWINYLRPVCLAVKDNLAVKRNFFL